MPFNSPVLDEIIYARVLITLQRMQLDEQDSKLRAHLGDLVGMDPEGTRHCQESLKRAWIRASESLGHEGAVEQELKLVA
ncbi:MAG: hypothetical protein GY811_26860 [Myxococcales bacterium]|nr:hypothetical protein [Myxococcales bacterium]